MENASKALLIAAAILLAILLISLGIMVFNRAKDTVTEANLDSEQAQTFNGKFTQYCGKNRAAADVNALVAAVQANNGTNAKTRVKIDTKDIKNTNNKYFMNSGMVDPTADSPGNYTMVFSNSYRYDVTYDLETTDSAFTKAGYIKVIKIKVGT